MAWKLQGRVATRTPAVIPVERDFVARVRESPDAQFLSFLTTGKIGFWGIVTPSFEPGSNNPGGLIRREGQIAEREWIKLRSQCGVQPVPQSHRPVQSRLRNASPTCADGASTNNPANKN